MQTPATARPAPHSVRPAPVAPVLSDRELTDQQRLTMREVRAMVGLCDSTIRAKIAAGKFPQPDYRDGTRCVRWSVGAVRRWLQATSLQQS